MRGAHLRMLVPVSGRQNIHGSAIAIPTRREADMGCLLVLLRLDRLAGKVHQSDRAESHQSRPGPQGRRDGVGLF